jgi:hypothetical protein
LFKEPWEGSLDLPRRVWACPSFVDTSDMMESIHGTKKETNLHT